MSIFPCMTAFLSRGGSYGQPSLIEELWNYFSDKYFSLDMTQYDNLNMGTGSIVTMSSIVLGLFIGIVIAAAMACYDKNILGDFVRKVVYEECLSPESAKTLYELGYARSMAVRSNLKRTTKLGRVVRSVERDAYERDTEAARAAYIEKHGSDKGFSAPPFKLDVDTAHFYIPDEEHYRAEVRFEKGGSGWRAFLLVLLVSVIGIALVCFLLPDMLQLVDNFIGIMNENDKVI